MPPSGVLLGGVDFADYYINLSGTVVASLAEAKEARVPVRWPSHPSRRAGRQNVY